MRVIFLATDAYGSGGGIAYYNRGLIEAISLHPDVVEVVVIVRHFTPPAGELPNKVRFITYGSGGKLQYILASFLQMFRPYDLMICGHINLLPLAGRIHKLKPSSKFVLQVHGIDAWEPDEKAKSWLSNIDEVWSVSNVTRDRMGKWAGLPCSKFRVMPNMIHLENYSTTPKRKDLLERYGLLNKKIIMTMGRLSEKEQYKGFDEDNKLYARIG